MSDASLSPSPIPVTLVARVDTLAAAATGPARLASPPAGRLASRTPISMSTPIPPSLADGTTFDFSVSDVSVSRSLEFALPSATLPDASADRGRAEASAFADSRADSEGTIGSSEFGGLPGAESFLRDAAAQRAWDVVVGLIASDASVDDDDASNSSFARAGSSDRSAGGSGTATGGSLSGRSGDTDGSSLATLPGAEQWLRSAETERREARREAGARGARGAKLPGLGERLVRRGECEPSGEGFRRVGAVRLGPKRLRHPPGGDEWLTSPGARARSTRTRARASARRSRTTRKVTRRSDAEGLTLGRDGRVDRDARGDGEEKIALRKKSSPTDTLGVRWAPPPPPPSDSQLADELRRRSTAYASRRTPQRRRGGDRPRSVPSLSLSPGTPSRRERRARPRRIRPSVRRRSTRRPFPSRRAMW